MAIEYSLDGVASNIEEQVVIASEVVTEVKQTRYSIAEINREIELVDRDIEILIARKNNLEERLSEITAVITAALTAALNQ